jgi:hypothetical protein
MKKKVSNTQRLKVFISEPTSYCKQFCIQYSPLSPLFKIPKKSKKRFSPKFQFQVIFRYLDTIPLGKLIATGESFKCRITGKCRTKGYVTVNFTGYIILRVGIAYAQMAGVLA